MSSMQTVYIKEHQEDFARNIFSANTLFEQILTFRMVEDLLRIGGYKLPVVSDEVLSENKEFFEKMKLEVIQKWTEATSRKVTRYPTSEIADMVGVRQQTVSRWVAQGRFSGVEREQPGQHVEIPSDSVLTMPNGTEVLVSELARKYEERKQMAEQELAQGEIVMIERQLTGFADKYRTIDDLKVRIESGENVEFGGLDLDVWSYLLQRKQELVGAILVPN